MPYLHCKGAESSGWFDVSQKNSARDNVMHEWDCYHDEDANLQLSIAADVSVVLYLSAYEEQWGSTPY